MPPRNGIPYRHSPVGVCDSLDGTETFPGAMTALQNLVPDPTTRNLWVPRPAALVSTVFPGFTTPGFISAQIVVGTFVYGMIASGRNAGHDEPFCYNLATNALVTISGVTSANTPVSPAATGAWTPPTMAVIGTKVTVTHPGFDGTSHFVGWIDTSNPATPAWSAGNTSGTALPAVPTWVAQFNGRAWYGVNPSNGQPAAIATDELDPTTRTNGTYVLTFGDNVPLTAGGGLALNNLLGGIVGSLIVFKGVSNMYQVTGDFASTSSPIAVNSLNVATGTYAPNSICPTPQGMAFMSPQGLRIVGFNAVVGDPIGGPAGGPDSPAGVVLPFIDAVVPSRLAAACNSKVLRISTQNGAAFGSPNQEYWFDLTRKIWSGPHTFPASLISVYGATFVTSPVGVPRSLWTSDVTPGLNASYTENGVALKWTYQPTLLPVRKDMNQCVMNATTLYMGFAAGAGPVSVVVQDENALPLGSVTLLPGGGATIWGEFVWGQALWGGQSNALAARQLNWSAPIEFDRMTLVATGQSATGVRLGDCYFRYQPLGYLAGSYTGAGA